MSYEIIFINKPDLSLSEVQDLLNPNINNELELLQSTKDRVKSKLIKAGLKFETYFNETGEMELHFDSYQIYLCYSEIAIIVPFHKENLSKKVNQEIEGIIQIHRNLAMTGYNSQTETLLTENFNFDKEFRNSKVNLSDFHNDYTLFMEKKEAEKAKKTRLIFQTIIIGFAIFGLIQLIMLLF